MFDHVTIRAADRGATERFYDTVLEPLGIAKSHADADGAMWEDFGMYAVDGSHPATRGLHVGFAAPSRAHVDRFWEAGTRAGYGKTRPAGGNLSRNARRRPSLPQGL